MLKMANRDLLVAFSFALLLHILVFLVKFSPSPPFLAERKKVVEISLVVSPPESLSFKKEMRIVSKPPKERPISSKEPRGLKKEMVSPDVPLTSNSSPSKEVIKGEEVPEGKEMPQKEAKALFRREKGEGVSEGEKGKTNLIRTSPNYRMNPKPPYPRMAKERGYEGTVLLEVEVLSSGMAGKIRLKKSSGYSCLDEPAIGAVKKWQFIPAKEGGKPIDMWVAIPIRFELR